MNELVSTFGINYKLLLAQAFNFGVLLLALWWFLYRPVLGMVENRRKIIEKGVLDASNAEKKLAQADEEKREIVGKAASEAEGIVANAKARADEKGANIVARAQERAESITEDASARADEAQRQALAESEKEIAKAAVLTAEKILKEK